MTLTLSAGARPASTTSLAAAVAAAAAGVYFGL